MTRQYVYDNMDGTTGAGLNTTGYLVSITMTDAMWTYQQALNDWYHTNISATADVLCVVQGLTSFDNGAHGHGVNDPIVQFWSSGRGWQTVIDFGEFGLTGTPHSTYRRLFQPGISQTMQFRVLNDDTVSRSWVGLTLAICDECVFPGMPITYGPGVMVAPLATAAHQAIASSGMMRTPLALTAVMNATGPGFMRVPIGVAPGALKPSYNNFLQVIG